MGVLAGYDGHYNDNRILDKSPQLYDYYTDEPHLLVYNFQKQLPFYRRNLQSRISYKTSIANSHNISATLVNEIRKIDSNTLFGRRQYDDVYTHDVIDQGSITNQSTTGNRNEQGHVSYLGRFNYDYKSKYMFEFSFREDGSYRYAPLEDGVSRFSTAWRLVGRDLS